jgi:hypothetical protein
MLDTSCVLTPTLPTGYLSNLPHLSEPLSTSLNLSSTYHGAVNAVTGSRAAFQQVVSSIGTHFNDPFDKGSLSRPRPHEF